MISNTKESEQISAEGRQFVAWVKGVATDQDLGNLLEFEYSDDNAIWTIRVIDHNWIDIAKEGESHFSRRSITFIDNTWTVFLPADRFDPWPGPVSQADRARHILKPLDLSLAEFSDSQIINISVWLASWVDNHAMPRFADQMEIYEIAKADHCQRYPHFAKSILPIFKAWMHCEEEKQNSVHPTLRLWVAVLQRHTGREIDAIQTTEFIERPTKGNGSRGCDQSTLALLSSTRSAALMDRAEHTGDGTCLAEARLQADRVNAISGNALELYRRIISLEKRLHFNR